MMKKIFILFSVFLLLLPAASSAASLANRLSGRILLQVEGNGEAWYVDPGNKTRYYLGRPSDAWQIMRARGLGISNENLAKIPEAKSNEKGDLSLRSRLSGKILLQVEGNGEAWYVYPPNQKRYYLGRPADAWRIMRELGLGITNANLSLIPQALNNGSSYESKTITTTRGNFDIELVTVDLNAPGLKINTATASAEDCDNNCPVKPLADYVAEYNGFAAIHGSYFCPPDYASCTGRVNSYFYPVLNSRTDKLINEKEIKWLQGAILVFDTAGKTYLFPQGPDFKSIADFEAVHQVKIQALISNSPALIQNGENIVLGQSMDDKQRNTKGYRGGIGIKGKTVYLVVAKSATVVDLASIMEALGAETALNLDGGGSSALYYNGGYKVGPGRKLPTAIVFSGS